MMKAPFLSEYTHRRSGSVQVIAVAALALLVNCKAAPEDNIADNLPPDDTKGDFTIPTTPTTSTTTTDVTSNTDSTTATGTDTATTSGTDSGSSTETTKPVTCEELVCRGHGGCEQIQGVALCICDDGYVLDDSNENCVVDETCVRFRFLDEKCRQVVGGAPAVSLFFGLDFCAGTAVLPEKLEEWATRDIQLQVLEGSEDILKNSESSSKIFPVKVESYVSIVLDVSKSVVGDASDGTPPAIDLDALITELRKFVASIKSGEAPVRVQLVLFGRSFVTYQDFTGDFNVLDQKLAAIKAGGASLPEEVGIYGSALFDAATHGINSTQRIRDLRSAVSEGGILSTGTVIVVTDGNDESGKTSSKISSLVNSTLSQVISIGISERVDDTILQTIGKHGSFLAPTPTDWAEAFSEVTQRVQNYPKRAYLLAYCSSKTSGEQEVRVSLGLPTDIKFDITSAGCKYDADEFSSDGSASCNARTLVEECDAIDCGGLTACGGCSDSECCSDGRCQGPSERYDCQRQDELCAATDKICTIEDAELDTSIYACLPPPQLGEICTTGCVPGESYCQKEDGAGTSDPGICVAVFPLGDKGRCEDGVQCASLNCTQTNPDSATDPLQCRTPALLYNNCGPKGSAVCEHGGYCTATNCAPRKKDGLSCSSNLECQSGLCVDRYCASTGLCYWSWQEKIPG